MPKESKAHFFDEKFNFSVKAQGFLPFFHSCDAFYLTSILEEGKLAPAQCTIFKNEKLLYLFYGRPAYKSSIKKAAGLHSLLPVSFILNADAINDIKRIAPFDTGAFTYGFFKKYMHPGMKLDSFFLTPDKTSISKTVSYFFDTNEQYYASRPRNQVEFDALHFEIESYYALLKGVGQGKVDDRKASIEVQLQSGILLNSNTVEAIILPENFLSSEIIQQKVINELKAEVITYESFGVPSNHYYTEVLALTKSYLTKKKYLHARTSNL
jgi:hypothetical protein